MMAYKLTTIWQQLPSNLSAQTENCIRIGCERSETGGRGYIFFRADDVAVPGKQFEKMMNLFSKYGVPLSLAVVPAWLTLDRWHYLKGFDQQNPKRLCWFQHGWRHVNHEREGKKQEFGDARKPDDIRRDLDRGKTRLRQLMQARFFQIFTPPWNRCSSIALRELIALGYTAISRSYNSKPPSPRDLPDFYTNVDLHTRKEKNPASGWQNLFQELEQTLASNYCGIMIHHQLMNDAAFGFLEILLKALKNQNHMQLVHLGDLAKIKISI